MSQTAAHLHCLVLDGVYRSDAEWVPEFIEAAAPTDEALHALLHTVIARLMKMLTRRGVLVEDTARCDKRVSFAPFSRLGSDPPLAPGQGEGV